MPTRLTHSACARIESVPDHRCGSPHLGRCLIQCCRMFGYPFLLINVRLSRQHYLCSCAGQLSSKLIELDSARAGVTARKRWPSAVTSNKGAGVSAKFAGGRPEFHLPEIP